ncbi:hypothetical protein ACF0H5_013638 [Mactra antiquata]
MDGAALERTMGNAKEEKKIGNEKEETESVEEKEDTGVVTIEVTRPEIHVGLFGAVAFGVGTMIGSGIFISPTGTLRATGSVGMSLVIWTVCGGIAMLIGLVYAELGSMIPQSGGDFNFIRKGLGDLLAFQSVWCLPLFNNTASMAVLSTVFADYLLAWIFGSCKPPVLMSKLIAVVVLLSIGIFNTYSARVGAYIQKISTVAKVAALVIVIIGGLVYVFQGETQYFQNSLEGTATDVQSYSIAIYSCYFAYGGFSRIVDIGDEIVNPRRNIPRAVVISISLVTILYVLTNISFFALLSKQEMLSSSAVGYDWALKCIKPAAFLITLGVLLSVYGANNGAAFGASRVMFAAARVGHYPEVMSYLNIDTSVPVISLFVLHSLSLLFLLVPGDIFVLIHMLSFVGAFLNLLATISLLRLRYVRRNQAKEEDEFQSPLLVPVACLLACLFLVVTPFVSEPKIEFLYGLSIIIAGFIVFIVFVRFQFKVPGIDTVTCFLQLFCNIAPTAKVD